MFELTLIDYALVFAVVCIGVAVLLHIRKEPNDAHGKYRT